jgi:O-antigen/teichoic acid export membrane protein
MSEQHKDLASGRRLARNVIWNFLGTGAPLLVGIVAIPILINSLGTERFGVLALAWMFVGYFSLFDLGLGRALTQMLARMLGSGEIESIPRLFWTAMVLVTALGVVGTLAAAGLSEWLVGDVLRVPVELREETLTSFYILAASIPVVIGTTGLRGTLEAYQRFDLVNAVRIPLGILTFLGPVMVSCSCTAGVVDCLCGVMHSRGARNPNFGPI